MSSTRNPVLLWADAAGGCTGTLIGDWPCAAHASTADEVLRQLREMLLWRVEHAPWSVDPDFVEPVLNEVKVDVRPQYRSADSRRIVPCPETLALRVPCVTGKQQNGLRVCVVPHLELRFNYEDPAALKSLVTHFVREALQGRSYLELLAALPPAKVDLNEITVRETTRARRIRPLERAEFRPLLAVADPWLSDRSRGFTSAAYGREELAARLARQLTTESTSLLLVGETGVGKSTLLLEAARRASKEGLLRTNEAGEDAEDEAGVPRFWRTTAGRIVAGMRYLGEWEERCEEVIAQLSRNDGILCFERALELLHIGGEGPGDSVGAFLLPYLQRGELRVVAEATPGEVDACRRLLPALLDVFQIVHVPEFEEATARDVLLRLAHAHASGAHLEVPPAQVALVQHLFRRFLPYATLPGPAAEFLRALIAELGRRAAPPPTSTLTAADVVGAFVRRTGLPEVFVRDDWPLDIDEVRAEFARQIIGQPAAVEAAGRVVATLKAGLTDPQRPAAVLMFCGPTGVGKTALAQTLARFCFGAVGAADRLIRIDLSEYAGPGAGYRFLNAPHGEPAAWLQRVRAQPFCVLLLDEIEKAAPEIFDILLGVLDEGRLTDRFGRVTNLRSAIIILTSNLGSSSPGSLGFTESTGPDYNAEVQRFFRPEFFNRLDAVVAFNPLTPEHVREIVRKELGELPQREGLAAARLQLEWTPAVEQAIANAGYDQRLGARPLQRALERLVVVPLARWRVAHPAAVEVRLRLDQASDGSIRVTAVDGAA